MEWNLDRKRPIAPQLCEQLSVQIAGGQFPPGCRLPSVRDIALSAGVNPNTVQKALESLAEEGIVYAERGSGWYVSDSAGAAAVRDEVVRARTAEYFEAMGALGLSEDEIKRYVEEWKK
ncbi:MAG: GntR family transcriptional regulator [Clostridia bacterium]|nr:GntR family transcriptional regulator [Clostridia bacterium]